MSARFSQRFTTKVHNHIINDAGQINGRHWHSKPIGNQQLWFQTNKHTYLGDKHVNHPNSFIILLSLQTSSFQERFLFFEALWNFVAKAKKKIFRLACLGQSRSCFAVWVFFLFFLRLWRHPVPMATVPISIMVKRRD